MRGSGQFNVADLINVIKRVYIMDLFHVGRKFGVSLKLLSQLLLHPW